MTVKRRVALLGWLRPRPRQYSPARTCNPVRPVVLAVDDNPLNLELLVTYLQDVDFDVVMAGRGREALETAANVLPHLVLLDVMRPRMDGYEVRRRLKANPATRFVPVVPVPGLRASAAYIFLAGQRRSGKRSSG